MKKVLYGVIVLLSMGSCSNSGKDLNTGSAQVFLDIVADPSHAITKGQTRAGGSTDIARYENSDNYFVKIQNDSDSKVAYEGLAGGMPLEMELSLGQYTMYAYLGTDVPAAFDSLYVYGEKQFSVEAGIATNVQVTCVPSNVMVNVSYEEGFDEYYSEYNLSFTTSNLTTPFVFAAADSIKDLYFKANKLDDKILMKLELKNLDGIELDPITLEQPIKPREFLDIKVAPKLIDVEGGLISGIQININDQTINKDTTIIIPGEMLPEIVQ
jgi:hypothetical protein